MNTRTILIAIAASVAAVFATIGANAAIDDSDTSQKPPTEAVAPELEANFALFRSEQSATTEKVAKATQTDVLATERGVNQGLARKALTTPDGDAVLASPTAEGACLGTSKFGVITCADVQELVDGKTVGAIVCSPHLPKDKVAAFGLVPDGVTNVIGDMSDGTQRNYSVVNNAFAILVDKSEPVPHWFSYERNGTEHRTRSSIPEDTLAC